MPSIIIYLIIGVTIFSSGAFSGWRVESWHRDSLEAKAQQLADLQVKQEADKANLASTELEKARQDAQAKQQPIIQTVDRIVTRKIYVRECFDADGLHAANLALQGPTAHPGQPDKPVPGPKPAPGAIGGSGASKTN